MKKYLALIIFAVTLQACTGAQMRANSLLSQVGQIVEKSKGCMSPIITKDVYSPIRQHTNLEDVRNISYQNLTDPSYISKEELILTKQLLKEAEPCKKEGFSSIVDLLPSLGVVIVNAENDGLKNANKLMRREITWGEYNQLQIKSIEAFNIAARPYLNQLEAEWTSDHNKELLIRQQFFNALAAYGQAMNAVNAANYANRPVLTTCRNMGGFTSCISN